MFLMKYRKPQEPQVLLSEEKRNHIHDYVQDRRCGYSTGFPAGKAEKNSGGKGKGGLRRKSVSSGKQQGIQQDGTRCRQEPHTPFIYETPVNDFLRERTKNTNQQKTVSSG